MDLSLCLRIASNTLFCSIGPKDLSLNTLSPDSTTSIPTVTDNLFAQGIIGQNLVAISFEPTTSSPVTNGELTFGAVDPTKFTGNFTSL
jgi:cathepsin E